MYEQRVRMLLGSAAGLIGLFLPWIKFKGIYGTVTISGLVFPHYFGIICAFLFVVTFIVALIDDRVKKPTKTISTTVLVISLISLLFAVCSIWLVETHAFRDSEQLLTSEDLRVAGNPGIGIYVAAGASALLVFFSLVDFDTKEKPVAA
jgi:hypothetical protein